MFLDSLLRSHSFKTTCSPQRLVREWQRYADQQEPLHREWQRLLAHQRRVDLTAKSGKAAVSPGYVKAASGFLTVRLSQMRQLTQPARKHLSVLQSLLTLRLVAEGPPSPAERANLQRLVRSLNMQAKMMKRMDESWQGLMLRCQSMGMLLVKGAKIPAQVQDPFSEEPRHLRVDPQDLDLVQSCLDDISEVAHAAHAMELGPLITRIHHTQARLRGVLDWPSDVATRLRIDGVYSRRMPERR